MKTVNKELWDKATKLAGKPYRIDVYHDEEAQGDAVYLARIAEMSGCMAQGATIEDALANLRDAAIDYIYSLLEDSLPVPPPLSLAVQTGGIAETFTPNVKWQTTVNTKFGREDRPIEFDQSQQELLYSHQTPL
jgi:predicted RNase H-like HicB family nuclease